MSSALGRFPDLAGHVRSQSTHSNISNRHRGCSTASNLRRAISPLQPALSKSNTRRLVIFHGSILEWEPPPPQKKGPCIHVRLSVNYRVPKKQMLCVGGDKLPFGWSFMSIAQVPMTWNPGDIWTLDIELEVGARIQYKYVILEEQEWSQLRDLRSQGMVPKHRTGTQPSPPPDNDTIQMKMAIVSWQPGPNRVLQMPCQDELDEMKPGIKIREPARPRTDYAEFEGKKVPLPDISEGTWEALTMSEDGHKLLDRRDVWAAPFWDETDPMFFRRP